MASQSFGYVGNILWVNLTAGTFSTEPTEHYKEWLGGSGISQWIMYRDTKPWMAPFDPAVPFIVGTGPLTGTLAPTSGRFNVDAKSPLTLGTGSSNAGGYVGPEIKFAGFDHIMIKGKAARPVYLFIEDGEAKIYDADHLWGKTTWETVDMIQADFEDPELQVMCIGPGGENLARGASIMVNKNRAFGRCGMGAVMGSKNLKAIAVRGSGTINIAEPERFMAAVNRVRDSYQISPITENFIRYGTLSIVDIKSKSSGFPYRNFQDLNIPEEMERNFNPETIKQKYAERITSCFACPLPCQRYFYVKEGPHAGLKTEVAQFESMVDFGSKMDIDDFSFCLKATALCNQYGLDVDLPGSTIAWAMECYEKGILTEKHFDGLKPAWGDAGVALELIRKIAYREGVGDILAEGVARAADIMGEDTRYYAFHIKGQDLYEPLRSTIGWALGACTATRGGGHTTGCPLCEINPKLNQDLVKEKFGLEQLGGPLDYEGKVELVHYYEILHRLNNSFGLCHFGTDWLDLNHPGIKEVSELFVAATGSELNVEQIKRNALRILNLEKVYNYIHAGFDRKNDYPPLRDMEEPVPSGAAKGFRLEKERFDQMLDEYYSGHGWDIKTGLPTRERLVELGLDNLADDLDPDQLKQQRMGLNH
ncbi:MAG: aldehyde ferredoxin oxidoreductase family protein [Bacillota bacterium]|nr:aldehyde ferredoxin oxidoreductase family protein [Bacillota bacterium]